MFIYKIPLELQIQTIRLMVRQVTLYKDKIDVQLHELAVTDLQRGSTENSRSKTKGLHPAFLKTGVPKPTTSGPRAAARGLQFISRRS